MLLLKFQPILLELFFLMVQMLFHSGNGQADSNQLISSPDAQLKPGLDVMEQSWFPDAFSQVENFYFSEPHVQNLFVSSDYSYPWVITLSFEVELNSGGHTTRYLND